MLEFARFKDEKEACDFLKNAASNPNSPDHKLATSLMGKAVKRVLREGGTWEFQGNMSRWERQGEKVAKASRPAIFKKVEVD